MNKLDRINELKKQITKFENAILKLRNDNDFGIHHQKLIKKFNNLIYFYKSELYQLSLN